MRVGRSAPGWLAYAGRWGSTVDAPAQQEWFRRAENPVSRTWLQTVRSLPHCLTWTASHVCRSVSGVFVSGALTIFLGERCFLWATSQLLLAQDKSLGKVSREPGGP